MEDEDSEKMAKYRKNERERRRRLAVSQGFAELFQILRLPEASKVDKATILSNSIDRIKELEDRLGQLQQENNELRVATGCN